jgi:large subunit ribosomal protein L10
VKVVKEQKLRAVEAVCKKLDEAVVIGLLDMQKIPSSQLQKIRKELRGKAEMKMIKKSILMFAAEKSKKESLKKLGELMPSQPSIVLTEMDPFKFYAFVSKLKLPSYAKEGDIVENDIKVSAGPTSLIPGPVISELQKVGIPASVQDGKIAIRKDATVLKAGGQVSADLVSIFRKLNIKPVKIGLKVVAMFKDGEIYKKEALELVNEFPKLLPQAFQHALNLSVAICYPTGQNIKILIAKAAKEANALKALGVKEVKESAGKPAESEKKGETK